MRCKICKIISRNFFSPAHERRLPYSRLQIWQFAGIPHTNFFATLNGSQEWQSHPMQFGACFHKSTSKPVRETSRQCNKGRSVGNANFVAAVYAAPLQKMKLSHEGDHVKAVLHEIQLFELLPPSAFSCPIRLKRVSL